MGGETRMIKIISSGAEILQKQNLAIRICAAPPIIMKPPPPGLGGGV